MEKNAQAWGFDLLIGLTIFSLGILVFFIYSINSTSDSEQEFEILITNGNIIADSILSEGSPNNWNSLDVRAIGILSSGKINLTKLERFYSLSISDYDKTKILFNTDFDYFFSFDSNITVNNKSLSGIGYTGSMEEIKNRSSNFIRITRFAIYQNKPVNIYVYIWN